MLDTLAVKRINRPTRMLHMLGGYASLLSWLEESETGKNNLERNVLVTFFSENILLSMVAEKVLKNRKKQPNQFLYGMSNF